MVLVICHPCSGPFKCGEGDCSVCGAYLHQQYRALLQGVSSVEEGQAVFETVLAALPEGSTDWLAASYVADEEGML